MSRSDIRMAQDDSKTFDPVQFMLHVEWERLVFRLAPSAMLDL